MNKTKYLMIFFMINHMLLLSVHCKEAQDSCQYKKLQCDRKENKKYACTVQAPVDGDLCIEVNPPACQKIENVTASKDIKINWTNSTISIEIPSKIHCNEPSVLLNITCSNGNLLEANVRIKPPGIELRNETDTVLGKPLILVCNATGLNDIDTHMVFYGLPAYDLSCPRPPLTVRVISDGIITTRINDICNLVIIKLIRGYTGTYRCEIDPLNSDTCHNLTSNGTEIRLGPDKSDTGHHTALVVAPVTGTFVTAFVIIVVLLVCIYRQKKKKTPAPPVGRSYGALPHPNYKEYQRKNERDEFNTLKENQGHTYDVV